MLLVASDVSSFSASGIRTPAPAPFWRPLDSGPGLCRVMTFVPEEEEEEAEDPVLLFVVRRHFLSLLPSSVIEIPLFDFGTLYSNSIEGDSSLNLRHTFKIYITKQSIIYRQNAKENYRRCLSNNQRF